ncbi:MAG TPA: FHA domain-containing protein [Planctomycetota bacterium]|nr:FHA domain-containing protein [Planctomycetota bacterium]
MASSELLAGGELLGGEERAPLLRYRSEQGEETTFALEGRARTTIGRAPGCDLVLRDSRVSRHHATIEPIEDHEWLLRDEGSSNGTFLNGFRLRGRVGFCLRQGDVIEVGDHRLAFSCGAAAPAKPERNSLAFHVPELTRDGYVNLDFAERRDLQVAVQRAFEGVSRLVGLDRALGVVANALDGHAVAFFAQDPSGGMRAIAALPSIAAAASLAPAAQTAWTTRQGLLETESAPEAVARAEETRSHAAAGIAAIPRLVGHPSVLVLERVGARRLDRSDVALLAVFADRIGLALSAQGGRLEDTRPGFAA